MGELRPTRMQRSGRSGARCGAGLIQPDRASNPRVISVAAWDLREIPNGLPPARHQPNGLPQRGARAASKVEPDPEAVGRSLKTWRNPSVPKQILEVAGVR